jgi:hypothetical protein
MIYKIAYAAFAISFLVGTVLDNKFNGSDIKIVQGLIIFMVVVAQMCGVGE